MMRGHLLIAILALCGCDALWGSSKVCSDNHCDSAGQGTGSPRDMAMAPPRDMAMGLCDGATVYTLSTKSYTVADVSSVSDLCGLGIASILHSVVKVVNNNGTIEVCGPGKDLGDCDNSLGSGVLSCNHAILTRDPFTGPQEDDGNCIATYTRGGELTVTGNDKFTLNYHEKDTDRTGTCKPPMLTCTIDAQLTIK